MVTDGPGEPDGLPGAGLYGARSGDAEPEYARPGHDTAASDVGGAAAVNDAAASDVTAGGAEPSNRTAPAPGPDKSGPDKSGPDKRYATELGQVPPVRPNDPITPFIRPPGPRRRRNEWPILILALLAAGLVMAVCCIAGFAVYSGYGMRIK